MYSLMPTLGARGGMPAPGHLELEVPSFGFGRYAFQAVSGKGVQNGLD